MGKNIKAWVSSDTKTAFQKAATRHGTSESRLLSHILDAFLKNNQIDVELKTPTEIKNNKMDFRISTCMKAELRKRAGEQGMKSGPYAVVLLRAHLSRKPYFTEHELEVLRQCNNELTAIGRNINQIARALNTSLDNVHMAQAAELGQVAALVKANRDYVRNLIRANLSAWGIERVKEKY